MIHLRTFNLEKINEIEHYVLLESLSRDKGVTNYVSRNFLEWVKKQESVGDEKVEVGKSYVIEKEGRYIGVIGSLNFSNDGILEVWYAIKKNLRGKGYGEKILGEITPHLIEHIDGLNDIKLKIDVTNKGSKKVAERNGYVKVASETIDGVESWYYFGPDYSNSKSTDRKR